MVIEKQIGATVSLSNIALAMYVPGFCQRSSSSFKGLSLFKYYIKLWELANKCHLNTLIQFNIRTT